jgi:putative transposase
VMQRATHRAALYPAGQAGPERLIERFNKTYRNEVLDAYVSESIEQVRAITESWLREYKEEHRTTASAECRPSASCRGEQRSGVCF